MKIETERPQWSMRTLASLSGNTFLKPEIVTGRLTRWGYDIVSQQVDEDIVTIRFRESKKLRNTPLDQRKQIWLGLDDVDYPDKASRDRVNSAYSLSEPQSRFKPGCEFVDKSSYYIGDDGREYATFEQLEEANQRWREAQVIKNNYLDAKIINNNVESNKPNLSFINPKPWDFDQKNQ